MKKKIVFSLLILGVISAKAQTPETGTISITPYIGCGISNYLKDVEHNGMKAETRPRGVFTLGAELSYQMNYWFAVSGGLSYVNNGSNFDNQGVRFGKWTTNYFNMPLMAHFYIMDGLAINVGLQPAFLLSARETMDDIDVKDNLRSTDIQIPLGVSYEYKNFVIDARYTLGTVDILKDGKTYYPILDNGVNSEQGNGPLYNDLYNKYLTVTIGYKFNAF